MQLISIPVDINQAAIIVTLSRRFTMARLEGYAIYSRTRHTIINSFMCNTCSLHTRLGATTWLGFVHQMAEPLSVRSSPTSVSRSRAASLMKFALCKLIGGAECLTIGWLVVAADSILRPGQAEPCRPRSRELEASVCSSFRSYPRLLTWTSMPCPVITLRPGSP